MFIYFSVVSTWFNWENISVTWHTSLDVASSVKNKSHNIGSLSYRTRIGEVGELWWRNNFKSNMPSKANLERSF